MFSRILIRNLCKATMKIMNSINIELIGKTIYYHQSPVRLKETEALILMATENCTSEDIKRFERFIIFSILF